MIYYERQNIESDQNISIPKSQAETQESQPDNASMNNSEHQTNDPLQRHHDTPCLDTGSDTTQNLPRTLIS